jgi:hypothetical protein
MRTEIRWSTPPPLVSRLRPWWAKGEDQYADPDRDAIADHHPMWVGRLDQGVESDPAAFADLDAAQPVEHHPCRVATWCIEREHLQDTITDARDLRVHDSLLFRSM